MYTVKQLSKLAGITPRTLHYYDEIGLLKPSRLGENGYRYYGEDALLRLQQIMFYRELDLPLAQIKEIMERRDFLVLSALESHKQALQKRITHLERLIRTVDHTIHHLEGTAEMSKKQLFEAFSDEQQAEYEKEAMQQYDPETVKSASKKWQRYSPADKQRIMDEGAAIYQDMVKALPKGAASDEAQSCVARWREHIGYFWTPDKEQLWGLVNGYNDDPRFRANFDALDPGLAPFFREAVKYYLAK